MRFLELKIPPPVVAVAIAAAMYVASRWIPLLQFDFPARRLLAGVFVAVGIAVNLAGIWAFRQHSTTVNPLHPGKTTSLVTEGVFRWTRNPMYLGILLILTGWAIWLATVVSLFGLPLLVIYLTRFQILPEERALRAKFGGAMATYEQQVRRWL
jgi:protein-S-isoprenylcysteine O-methyltransferase Ste14